MLDEQELGAAELTVLRDTRIVLGHWFAEVLPNAMALQDFSALAAMVQVSLGHARVLDAVAAEAAGRTPPSRVVVPGRDDLASMELLDRPPADWTDFVVTAALAEWALAARLGTLAGMGGEGRVAAVAGRLLGESSFVLDYVNGWLRVVAGEDPDGVRTRLTERAPLLATWYADAADAELRSVLERAGALEPGWDPPEPVATGAGWDRQRRRPHGSLVPAGLADGVADRPIS